MIELPLPSGGALWIAPHAIVAIHAAPPLGSPRPVSQVYIAGGSFRVLGTVEEVRAAMAPRPKVEEPEDDHFADFLASCTCAEPGSWIAAADLSEAADEWCRENALHSWSYTELSQQMLRRGHTAVGRPVRQYPDLALLQRTKKADRRGY